MKARLIKTTHPQHVDTMAQIMLKGGVVGAIWGHHLYFLACNACDIKAVERMNKIKGRAVDQVFASPGAVEEAEEFADIKKSKGLIFVAKRFNMLPAKYLEFLFRKFPIGVELFASSRAPSSVTFETYDGKTIWIAAHMGDKSYCHFLETVRSLRRAGQRIVFAGTSLNLKGDNTLTVRELDKVVEDFGGKVDAISVHPKSKNLKKLRFSTSCSVVSFVGKRPKLLRLGCTKVETLKKYIPGLKIPQNLTSTRR